MRGGHTATGPGNNALCLTTARHVPRAGLFFLLAVITRLAWLKNHKTGLCCPDLFPWLSDDSKMPWPCDVWTANCFITVPYQSPCFRACVPTVCLVLPARTHNLTALTEVRFCIYWFRLGMNCTAAFLPRCPHRTLDRIL